MRRYYAGYHQLSREFSYDSGWTAYAFKTKAARDGWVETTNARQLRDGVTSSPRCEAITRSIAKRITGSWVREDAPITRSECGLDGPPDEVVGHMLEVQTGGYYNPHYWD